MNDDPRARGDEITEGGTGLAANGGYGGMRSADGDGQGSRAVLNESAPGPDGSAASGADAHGGGGRDAQEPDREPERKRRSWWIELPILFVFALVLALLLKTFVVQAFFIPSSSMEPTLRPGDKVLVNKLVYDFRPIHRGDIVVFNGEGSWNAAPARPTPPLTRLWNDVTGLFGTAPGVHDYIKRVIGLPGDHVACCTDGRVTVNGVPLHERSYLYPGNVPSATRFKITVPAGRLWVMGDHRAVSWDSRGHQSYPGNGTIPESQVVGRAFLIIAPLSRWRILPIPATFEQPALNRPAAALPGAQAPLPSVIAAVAPVAGAPGAPFGAGLAGALPLTLIQRRLRRRLGRRRRRG